MPEFIDQDNTVVWLAIAIDIMHQTGFAGRENIHITSRLQLPVLFLEF